MATPTTRRPALPVSLRLDDDPDYRRAQEARDAAQALVATEERRQRQLAEGPAPDDDDDDDQEATLTERRAGVHRALVSARRKLSTAEADLEQHHRRLSAEVCARLLPYYRREIMRPLADALTVLVAANAAERAFRDALLEAGVYFAGTLRPMPVAGIGDDPDDPNTAAAHWLAEARHHNLID